MKTKNLFVLVFALIYIGSSVDDCTPLYTRLFYGSLYAKDATKFTNNLPTSLEVKFDTKSECGESSVVWSFGGRNKRPRTTICTRVALPFTLEATVADTIFKTYVHSCQIPRLPTLDEFTYTVNVKDAAGAIQKSQTYTIAGFSKRSQFKTIVIADWGVIKTKPFTPVKEKFAAILADKENNKINALLIPGDVGYDLEDKNGQIYTGFMDMLSQVSPYWPILPVRGNHEAKRPLSKLIYATSFQLYNLANDTINIQVYSFPNVNFLIFDPYLKYYGRGTPEEYATKVQLMNQTLLALSNQQNKMLIGSSHFPLTCVQSASIDCFASLKATPEMYDLFDQYGMDLYISGHRHDYERNSPYKNKTFQLQENTPYDRHRLVSLVEGIGGNDIDMVLATPSVIAPQNQKVIAGTTGFGIMTISETRRQAELQYDQILTNSTTPGDSFVIKSKSLVPGRFRSK